MASASMMTEVLRGKSEAEARLLFEDFHRLCTEEGFTLEQAETEDPDALERLQVLAGVREFPVRVKCATLAWHAMRSEEHTSELQSLMRISYAVFCLKKKNKKSQLQH